MGDYDDDTDDESAHDNYGIKYRSPDYWLGVEDRKPPTMRDRLRRVGARVASFVSRSRSSLLVTVASLGVLVVTFHVLSRAPFHFEPEIAVRGPVPRVHPFVPNDSRLDETRPAVDYRGARDWAEVKKCLVDDIPCNPAYPLGKTVVEARVLDADATVFDLAASYLKIPTGKASVDLPLAKDTKLSLLEWGIDAKGKVLSLTAPLQVVWEMIVEMGLAILAGAAAARLAFHFRKDTNGFEFYEDHRTKIIANGVMAASLFVMMTMHGPILWEGPAVLWTLLSVLRTNGTRVLAMVEVASSATTAMVLQERVVTPLPSLAQLYGPLGVMVAPIVAIGAISTCCWALAIVGFARRI